MKYTTIVLLLSLVFSFPVFSQEKRDYNWIMGKDSQSGNPNFGVQKMFFGKNGIELEYTWTDMDMKVTSTSMSDTQGNLLFYTNGCWVANTEHEEMENGGNINYSNIYQSSCNNSGYRVPEGIISILKPGSEDYYYLFHLRRIYVSDPVYDYRVDGLMCTEIDMTKNGGLGVVVKKNQKIINDTIFDCGIEMIKHSNNIDWWILIPDMDTNIMYRMLITNDSLLGPFEQSIGLPLIEPDQSTGQAVFSPDGAKYTRYSKNQQLFLYDFDRSTGLLSNFQHLQVSGDTIPTYGGVAISPNSRYLYVSNALHLYQFDLEAPDIQASKVLIAEYDGFLEDSLAFFPTYFYLMQLAPDCRIYMNTFGNFKHLHVINYPDNPGQDCDFRQHHINLTTWNWGTLPNFPNYRLGTSYPVCDTALHKVFTSTGMAFMPPRMPLKIYPNPARGVVWIEWDNEVFDSAQYGESEDVKIRVFDAMGKQVHVQQINALTLDSKISVSKWAEGMYMVVLEASGVKVATEKLLILIEPVLRISIFLHTSLSHKCMCICLPSLMGKQWYTDMIPWKTESLFLYN